MKFTIPWLYHVDDPLLPMRRTISIPLPRWLMRLFGKDGTGITVEIITTPHEL